MYLREVTSMGNHAFQVTWNPWKIATVGIAVVITTALVTGLVVANWSGAGKANEPPRPVAAVTGGAPRNDTGVRSNRAVSRRPNTTDVLEKAVIGGAIGAGVGAGAWAYALRQPGGSDLKAREFV